jgi:hypothetical protein
MPGAWAGLRRVDLGADLSRAEHVGDRAGYKASSNQSSACGGARAGAKVAGVHGKPSVASWARARAESTTATPRHRRAGRHDRRYRVALRAGSRAMWL